MDPMLIQDQTSAPSADDRPRQGMQSVRTLILRYIEEYLATNSMQKKFAVLEGLITFCTPYIDDAKDRATLQGILEGDKVLNPKTDFINKYRNQNAAGTSWDEIRESDRASMLPRLRTVWLIVHRIIVKQGLLPWAFADPVRDLQNRMFQETMAAMDDRLRAVPRPDAPLPDDDRPIKQREVMPWEEGYEEQGSIDALMGEVQEKLSEEENEVVLPEHPDEDGAPVTDDEIEEAAAIWGNLIRESVKKRSE